MLTLCFRLDVSCTSLIPLHRYHRPTPSFNNLPHIRRFLWDQERELWEIFQEFDKNGDGRLDAKEMRAALSRGGIDITPSTADDLVGFLASGAEGGPRGVGNDTYITFQEFRDFLFMLPRKATPFEIYKCTLSLLADSLPCGC
jgi:hypothetical protein